MKTITVRFAVRAAVAFLVAFACSTASAGDSPWTLRFYGALVQTSESKVSAAVGNVYSSVDLGASGGFGLGAEYRLSTRVGLEISTLFTALEVGFEVSTEGPARLEGVELGMMPLSIGVPVHFGAGRRTDIWIAPTINYVSYQDVGASLTRQQFRTYIDVASDTAFGAAVGLDAGFGSKGNWAFSTGIRYLKTNAGGTDIDPLIVTVGFAYRF